MPSIALTFGHLERNSIMIVVIAMYHSQRAFRGTTNTVDSSARTVCNTVRNFVLGFLFGTSVNHAIIGWRGCRKTKANSRNPNDISPLPTTFHRVRRKKIDLERRVLSFTT
jgi:hypothetical protein